MSVASALHDSHNRATSNARVGSTVTGSINGAAWTNSVTYTGGARLGLYYYTASTNTQYPMTLTSSSFYANVPEPATATLWAVLALAGNLVCANRRRASLTRSQPASGARGRPPRSRCSPRSARSAWGGDGILQPLEARLRRSGTSPPRSRCSPRALRAAGPGSGTRALNLWARTEMSKEVDVQ